MSFTHLKLHSQSQSLVVSGESGAGKTETNKHLMSYLIWRAGTAFASARPGDKDAGGSMDLAKDIIDTNPVLEAFGNAKTTRNNNSSRFGKYVNLKFNQQHKITGAEIRTFLLEKSRVNSASAAGERSYHIFYNILAGSQARPPHPAPTAPSPRQAHCANARGRSPTESLRSLCVRWTAAARPA